MTWTYTNDPAGVPRDTVRFLIGDTDTADQQITDEEIAYLLTESGGNVYLAASAAAAAIASTYAREADSKSIHNVSRSYQRFQHYTDLSKALRRQASMKSGGMPYAGGISKSDKDRAKADTDRDLPYFSVGMLNNPRASSAAEEDTVSGD